MSKSLTKVIYRPENTSSVHEYTVIVNPEEVGFLPLFRLMDLSLAHLTSSLSTRNGRKEVSPLRLIVFDLF